MTTKVTVTKASLSPTSGVVDEVILTNPGGGLSLVDVQSLENVGGPAFAAIWSDENENPRTPRTIPLALAPHGLEDGEDHFAFGKMPVDGTVTAVEFIADDNASGDSTVVGTVEGGGNSLIAASVDLKTGIDDTLKAATLSATPAHLTLEAGDVIKAAVDPAGTQGGAEGLTCIVTYLPA